MTNFATAYRELNTAQRRAVDLIDGPLLVIAGPGTGKTQLLSARVANILEKTDTLPQNILCLTFTESGANNMRDRLTQFIGAAAYDVSISTYHAFGGDLINRYPEYFAESRQLTPVDELGQHELLKTIVENLPYDNPLKQVRHHLGDLIQTISEIKRALLTTKDLKAIAKDNQQFIVEGSKKLQPVFGGVSKMPSKVATAIPLFTQAYMVLKTLVPNDSPQRTVQPLALLAMNDLGEAISEATGSGKTTSLTAWKNKWLVKNENNDFILRGALENQRITALADVFQAYEEHLKHEGWYDFDDMILRSIDQLEKNPELKYTIQEQYLYIMLDEFQDTNAAQLKLIGLLTDNPVNEGHPNVMAVGDDDQAIYAFQGAQYSNMRDFYDMYRDVAVINLTDNYRSHADILQTAAYIAGQIKNRLNITNISKTLVARSSNTSPAVIKRIEFLSDIAQNDWVAGETKKLIDAGVSPRQIAVLAPGHKYLTALAPYMNDKNIPVHYERRENILETQSVKELLAMSRLVLALSARDMTAADALWPQVLSFPFWGCSVSEIWQLSWAITDSPRTAKLNWSKELLASAEYKHIALLFLALADMVEQESCETILDALIGTDAVPVREGDMSTVRSPFRSFYTSPEIQQQDPSLFYATTSHLTVLRAKLRDHQQVQPETLQLQDLITFVDMYEAAGERMTNTSPYNQQADAVQLMTVYKAKGLEFQHVFLLSCLDDVWGGSTLGNSNKLTLPPNLAHIRHSAATEDERLRIFFVAITRAKTGLYLTSASQSFSGKASRRLKYLDEEEQADGSFVARALPEAYQAVVHDEHEAVAQKLLELDWRTRHTDADHITKLQGLLENRLERYQLSPTHLNTFIDMEYGGPTNFFVGTLLRFPQAPTIGSLFGNAVHETMEWIQSTVNETGTLPDIDAILHQFDLHITSKRLMPQQLKLEVARGQQALRLYIAQRGHTFRPGNKAEYNFSREGVLVGDVHMSGKIDLMEIDPEHKTIVVVDYKTGKCYSKWERTLRLHKYAQQLYCYKLLIEGSHTFSGYTVNEGRLEFVEPDTDGHIRALSLKFNAEELDRTKRLLTAMWQHVKQLNLPDIASYPPTLTGTVHFEEDLLEGKI